MRRSLRDDALVRTGATFRLSGDHGRSAEFVTRLLDLEPSCAFEVGDRVGRRSGAIRRVSLWLLFHWLLDRLEPKADTLWQLANQGYVVDWFCLAASDATEHAIELDRPLLRRLLAVPGDLLLDVMGDDD